MTRPNIRPIIFALLLILIGCRSADLSAPPEIRYGEDVCDQCNMIINEPRFAAAYISENGATRRFDDIGEMFLYAKENGEAVHIYWVHDYESESWIEADTATYVHDTELTTPMGWGLAGFSAMEDAETYAMEHGGTAITYDALRDGVLNGDLMPQGMAQHDH